MARKPVKKTKRVAKKKAAAKSQKRPSSAATASTLSVLDGPMKDVIHDAFMKRR